MFHVQTIDLTRIREVGTFFAKLCQKLVFPALRTRAEAASTDLSTSDVDKQESPFPSDSCVTYVKNLGAMARNCPPRRGLSTPRPKKTCLGPHSSPTTPRAGGGLMFVN